MVLVVVTAPDLQTLNLTPVAAVLEPMLAGASPEDLVNQEQSLQLDLQFPRDPDDPRELSEIPEVRLWFVRLDSRYPWLPFFLDWRSGELARYGAMLVPHQFHRTEGIQFNPEALEIFVMAKVFVLKDWLTARGIPLEERLVFFTQMFGYDMESEFLERV